MKRTCLILSLLAVAAMVPPAPRKRYKPVQAPTQGSGAAKLIAKPKPPAAAPNYNRLLAWEWLPSNGNDWSNTVFIVRSSPTLSQPVARWPVESWTPTNRYLFYINLEIPAVFFAVSASNTFTRLVSE